MPAPNGLEPLPALFRARLAESFQNAGLARWIDGPAANANYEVDLDIRAFELDAQTKEIHVDIAAWIVSLGSGRIIADQIFTLRIPVASTDSANVAAAMDQAASTVMTEIVAFVARKHLTRLPDSQAPERREGAASRA